MLAQAQVIEVRHDERITRHPDTQCRIFEPDLLPPWRRLLVVLSNVPGYVAVRGMSKLFLFPISPSGDR